jgi:hypothetical protein
MLWNYECIWYVVEAINNMAKIFLLLLIICQNYSIYRLVFDIDFHPFMDATNITQMFLIIIEAY